MSNARVMRAKLSFLQATSWSYCAMSGLFYCSRSEGIDNGNPTSVGSPFCRDWKMASIKHFQLAAFKSGLRNIRLIPLGTRWSSSVSYPLSLRHTLENHAEVYHESLNHPERFWGDLASRRLKWMKQFDSVMNCDMKKGHIRWFEGGLINISGMSNSYIIFVSLVNTNELSCSIAHVSISLCRKLFGSSRGGRSQ